MSSSHHRLLCTLFFAGSSSHKPSRHSSFLYLCRFNFCSQRPLHHARFFSSSISPLTMPFNHRGRRAARERQQWKEKTRDASVNFVGEGIENLSIANSVGGNDHSSNIGASASGSSSSLQFGTIPTAMGSSISTGRQRGVWLPKSYTTASGTAASAEALSTKKGGEAGGALFQSQLTENFVVDNSTFSRAQIRATFYPKFENEKSDQEIRARMIDIVNNGLATLEVSLKHSGSLFMYAGHLGGAYAKNSFGNIYTAVGVFVLARMFQEAWGTAASEKQAEFNNFLEKNRICISMELVTAVLGDHGQRPIDDYVVVTAVTELGDGKPKFFSTPEVIAFCRKWRLPTNHVWLFSTRKSVTSFFAAFDALCEEGTATPVCQALNDVAEISVPGSKDHIKAQGEILEGLVARIVNRDSSEQMKKVLEEFPPPPLDGLGLELGPNLREVCATNRGDEKQQIKALLDRVGISMCPDHSDWSGDGIGGHSRSSDQDVLSKFLQAHPADYSTTKLQEMIRLMKQRHFPAAFKCYRNFHKIDSVSKDHLYYKMVIHVHSDSAFRRYQQEMRKNQGLWPLYRGFFVDIDLFKEQNEKAFEHANESNVRLKDLDNSCASSTETDGLADDDANLMIKLKFLTYKLRTFLIRNGLSMLFKDGPSAYKTYYLRQMKTWGTSAGKQREMSKMLDEWAAYISRKLGHRHLSASTYLSEAEPFLEQYARRSPLNQILVGSAGNFVKVENFQAIIEGRRDEEGDLHPDVDSESPSPSTPKFDMATKDKGLIVFFPGIPGCAKSALCKEILNTPGTFGDNRTVHSLMGDIIKGKYWPRVIEERKRKPYSITLADKNAPNEEVWKLIEDLCQSTKASAIPVVSDSEGTISNPFCLDALAVFMFRVLQRVNHPGNLDKSSPNAGFVLLMFYKLYDGKNRKEFESELTERFGALVKMPLLKIDREPLPDTLRSVLEEGLNLYRIHRSKHGRLEPDKGSYAKQWAQWENCIRETLFRNAEYLNSIQVPFEVASKQVIEQLKVVTKGGIRTPESAKRRFGNLVFAAVTLPVQEIKVLLEKLAKEESAVKVFLEGKGLESNLTKAHVTLAHKKSHGVIAVASYGIHHLERVPVELLALIFSEKLAALEARVGSIDGEKVVSKNEWPHATIWTGDGTSAKEANALPQLLSEGRATRVEIDPPFTVEGVVDFY